ncbi:MAG: thiol peroxidase [Armatimonadetes bacterium]|nr:thiol peroxidase [Armatimonadota bacterium]
MALERLGAVTFKGAPMTLVGPELQVGDDAPNFNVISSDLSQVNLHSDEGRVRLVIAVPSLDTPVCSLETKTFSGHVKDLPENSVVYVVSADLPFAQKRFCATEGIENVKTLSDHREMSFATNYGVLIKELQLLARSVFVIDPQNKISYKQIVGEITSEPDYHAALSATQAAANR